MFPEGASDTLIQSSLLTEYLSILKRYLLNTIFKSVILQRFFESFSWPTTGPSTAKRYRKAFLEVIVFHYKRTVTYVLAYNLCSLNFFSLHLIKISRTFFKNLSVYLYT